jgi:SagB-type dehydrogenase family enzyme
MIGRRQKTKSRLRFLLIALIMATSVSAYSCTDSKVGNTPALPAEEVTPIKLPEPRYDSNVSLEESLLFRRSIRAYTGEPLTLPELSQLLWAAQGITDPAGYRTAPSAGGLYPLDIYAVVGDVRDLDPGIYQYEPPGHEINKIVDGDQRNTLADAALGQEWVAEGAVSFVFIGVYRRTTVKYGDRGIRYVQLEAGHAAQNLCLEATALDLGAVTVGAFQDDRITGLLNLTKDEQPLYVIPVGRR